MITPAEFTERIESFLKTSDMTATRFGVEVLRDPNFVHDVRKGRVPSITVAHQVLDFIDKHSPASEPERIAS